MMCSGPRGPPGSRQLARLHRKGRGRSLASLLVAMTFPAQSKTNMSACIQVHSVNIMSNSFSISDARPPPPRRQVRSVKRHAELRGSAPRRTGRRASASQATGRSRLRSRKPPLPRAAKLPRSGGEDVTAWRLSCAESPLKTLGGSGPRMSETLQTTSRWQGLSRLADGRGIADR